MTFFIVLLICINIVKGILLKNKRTSITTSFYEMHYMNGIFENQKNELEYIF